MCRSDVQVSLEVRLDLESLLSVQTIKELQRHGKRFKIVTKTGVNQ